jgi:hypothetical protein
MPFHDFKGFRKRLELWIAHRFTHLFVIFK